MNNYYSGDISVASSDVKFGYAFGDAHETVTANEKIYNLLIKHNYYPAGQTGIGISGQLDKETAATGVSAADFAATIG